MTTLSEIVTQTTLKVKVNQSHLQWGYGGPMISIQCEFDDPSSVKSVIRLANLGYFSAQMTLKVKVNQHHFQ